MSPALPGLPHPSLAISFLLILEWYFLFLFGRLLFLLRRLPVPLQKRDREFEGLTPEAVEEWFRQGAAALDRLLERKRPLTVGVFAGQGLETVNAIADECGLDLVQLSGDESWRDCLLIARQVIKVVHVEKGAAAGDLLRRIEGGTAIACLLDTAAGGAYGGTGRTMDWTVVREVAARLPIVLAGGLTPDNVGEAVRAVRPWGVDVSSGVETGGQKDAQKIGTFVRAAKGAQVW